MATYGSNKKIITLDQNGESGYATKVQAHEAGMDAARAAIRAEGGCPTTCPQEGGKKLLPIRIAAEVDIESAVKVYRYTASERDHSYGWYLNGEMNTCCQCAENAKSE